MPELKNALLLLGAALVYFSVLAVLFRARDRVGLGTFFCALGVMHFLETYLASTLYVALPLGIVASPGSTVLFTGKLLLLLMVYIREDAVIVRQPIYGLLIGNGLLIALAFLMLHHQLPDIGTGRPDFGLLKDMGALMIWGTAVLFVDCILMILLYERLRTLCGQRTTLRIAITGAVILTFDQVAFYAGLHILKGAAPSVLVGGWAAKMAAVAVFSALAGGYLRWFERPRLPHVVSPPLIDIFDTLTYRERYEDLVARSGRDALTGALDRGRLDQQARRQVDEAARAGRSLSLLVIDIDHFKNLNDRFGHSTGDAVLRRIAQVIMDSVRSGDQVFRYGGEEFVVIADDLSHAGALALGERIRRNIAGEVDPALPRVTISVGLATCADDASDYEGLFSTADTRLYRAKESGRNCVMGAFAANSDAAMRLAHAG